jgi:transposase InsO family protein
VRELIRQMSKANPLWGAPRIHGELLKLGIEISQATVGKYMARRLGPPSPTWRSFLRNHADGIAALDMSVVPSATFRLLFVMLILAHDRRKIVRFDVTQNPTAGWLSRQVTEAFPWETAPRFLLRDRDASYGSIFTKRVEAMGITEVVTAPRSPWQNAYVERVIGSIRRECLDHVVVFNERHLYRVLSSSFANASIAEKRLPGSASHRAPGPWESERAPSGRWPASSLPATRRLISLVVVPVR